MTTLLPEQVDALRHIQNICGRLAVDVVVIGAIAYRLWVDDQHRLTEDVDLVVALDLVDLPRLTDPLVAGGWRQDPRREHRWISPSGARTDLLPAGVQARRDGYLDWPLGETRMSLVGFDHVFRDAVERELAPGLVGKVVPLVVLTLLKIVSYLDRFDTRTSTISLPSQRPTSKMVSGGSATKCSTVAPTITTPLWLVGGRADHHAYDSRRFRSLPR
jgi:predicted nucleotidyltransferase